jgi:hypothetical protein
MRRLNLVVSDEAGAVLDTIKTEGGFKSLDNAMDHFLRSQIKPKYSGSTHIYEQIIGK